MLALEWLSAPPVLQGSADEANKQGAHPQDDMQRQRPVQHHAHAEETGYFGTSDKAKANERGEDTQGRLGAVPHGV